MTRTIALALLAGCSGSEPSTSGAGPTWYRDVQPLVRDHCAGCHQAGGIAPMALDDYASAKEWSAAMATAVEARTMPPWLENGDGSCASFRDSRWLDDDAVDTISRWADAGAPEGDPADADPAPIPAPPALDRVDRTVSTPLFVPRIVGSSYAESDEYRCFRVGSVDADEFLTGYEVRPGNAAIVHHVLLMPVDPAGPSYSGGTNADAFDRIDGADGRDGWPCFGGAGEDLSILGIPAVWAPGMGAVEFPDVGVALRAGEELVMQVHYNLADPANVGSSDQTAIDLRTDAHVDRVGYLALPDAFLSSLFYGDPEVIPPGEPSYTFSFEGTGTEILQAAGAPLETWSSGFDLVGIMPHMHQLGHRQDVQLARGDGSQQCLSDVEQWNFAWQLQYFYEQPVHVDPDDTLRVTCDWDSTSRDVPTLPGWGTGNEMCLATMMVVPDAQ